MVAGEPLVVAAKWTSVVVVHCPSPSARTTLAASLHARGSEPKAESNHRLEFSLGWPLRAGYRLAFAGFMMVIRAVLRTFTLGAGGFLGGSYFIGFLGMAIM